MIDVLTNYITLYCDLGLNYTRLTSFTEFNSLGQQGTYLCRESIFRLSEIHSGRKNLLNYI